MRVAFISFYITIISIMTPSLARSAEIEGLWVRGDGNAHVRIQPCGPKICAVNTWIRNESEQHEHVGDVLIFDVKTADGGYSGTAYDPQRNLKLSAHLSLVGDSLASKGCVLAGILCKTMHWTRAK